MCKENQPTKELLVELCNKRAHYNLGDAEYLECANFLFFTSWFEELLFNDDVKQNPQNTKKLCEEITPKINLSQFDFCGEYWCKRYLQDGRVRTHKFNNLKLHKKYVDEVEIALWAFKERQERNDKLLFAYLMITYRFRNNMFHGSKGLIRLHEYTEQFQLINRFLYLLLDQILEVKYWGFNDL